MAEMPSPEEMKKRREAAAQYALMRDRPMSVADFAPEEEPPAAFASGSPSSPEGQRVYRAMEQGSLTPQGAPSATALMAEEALGGPVVQAAGKALKAAPLVGAAAEGLGSMAGRAKELVKGALKGKADEVVGEAATAGVKKADEAADAAKQWQEKGVESPYFKRWFGDSKVVDKGGKPLVVYKGTTRTVDETYRPTGGLEVPRAVFFSDNADVAEPYRYPREYGEFLYDRYDEASGEYVEVAPGALIESYISMKNPLVLVGEEAQKFTDDAGRQSRAVDRAKSEGFDGIIAKNVVEDEEVGTTYVVFDSAQIKSVDNRGTFDPKDPRIAYGVGAGAVAEQARKDDE